MSEPARWKPTPAQLVAAADKVIPDVLGPNLRVLFCGINPSLYSASVGHHFGRPGNRFWPALHQAGFTPRLFSAFEDRELLHYGAGITNLVARATATAAELSEEELLAGGRLLTRKVRRHRPAVVAFVGITAYRVAFRLPEAKIGPQDEPLAGAKVWVLPNPSGLNAHYRLADLARLFAELHDAVYPRRKK